MAAAGRRENIITAGLQLHLDAGDAGSYPGSGQVWSDLTANDFDFHIGETSSSERSDPTFNGSAGAKSINEYFACDGRDWFKQSAAFSGSIMRLAGRNAQPFTMEAWIYEVASARASLRRRVAADRIVEPVDVSGHCVLAWLLGLPGARPDQFGLMVLKNVSTTGCRCCAWPLIEIRPCFLSTA